MVLRGLGEPRLWCCECMNPLRLASLAASPLLLAQKGEVTVASRFPWPFGWTLHSLGSRLRENDGGFAGMTGVRSE